MHYFLKTEKKTGQTLVGLVSQAQFTTPNAWHNEATARARACNVRLMHKLFFNVFVRPKYIKK